MTVPVPIKVSDDQFSWDLPGGTVVLSYAQFDELIDDLIAVQCSEVQPTGPDTIAELEGRA